MKRLLFLLMAVLFAVGMPQRALAGMPSFTLSDLAAMRLEGISFFVGILLLVAYVIKRLWNFYRKDFPNLPELNFKKSLGLVLLWGLAFHLVLSMITGTREIMTPKAWEREGLIYKLKDSIEEDENGGEIVLAKMRREKLSTLRIALWSYAQNHKGKFPPGPQAAEIPNEAWQVLEQSNLRYQYVQGLQADVGLAPLVYEPGVYGEQRYVLFTNGTIRRMDIELIHQMVNGNRK